MTSISTSRPLPTVCSVALKEWAVTINALGQGKQLLLMRKGGISEQGKDFRVIHPEFLLYPTYEHQQSDLLKTIHQYELQRTINDCTSPEIISFSHWARVEQVIDLTEQWKLKNLFPYHIWTSDYADKRFRWKPTRPLSILLLKVYKLEHPQNIPLLPRYGGCSSWVDLAEEVSLGTVTSVLPDDDFERSIDLICKALRVPARS